MARKYKPSSPAIKPDRAGPPMTTPGNVRAFDMRPKPVVDPRRTDGAVTPLNPDAVLNSHR